MTNVTKLILIALCLQAGLVLESAHAKDCRKLDNTCTKLSEREDSAGDTDMCLAAAKAKGLHGCVKETKNVPQFFYDEFGEEADDSAENFFEEELAEGPGKYNWRCYACPFPQP